MKFDCAVDIEIPENVSPEYLLWIAVVDRAIYDFCTFADWYCQRLTREYGRRRKHISNTAEIAMLRELSILECFLFNPVPEPYNLQWIGEHVFSCGAGVCDNIRARCEAGHKANLDVYATSDKLDPLIKLYEQRKKRKVTPTSVEDIDITLLARPRLRRRSSLN